MKHSDLVAAVEETDEAHGMYQLLGYIGENERGVLRFVCTGWRCACGIAFTSGDEAERTAARRNHRALMIVARMISLSYDVSSSDEQTE